MDDGEHWLSPHEWTKFELNTNLLATVFKEYRKEHDLNQKELGQLLNLDQSYISKIETGQRQVRDVATLLEFAQRLRVSPTMVGLSKPLLQPISMPSTPAHVGEVDVVESSQQAWCRVRRYLNEQRSNLARAASDLYQREARVGSVPFIARHDWMPDRPIRLEDICLNWTGTPVPVPVTGVEPEAAGVLPLRAAGRRFERYTTAIRYLDRPSLFENRPSYRLLRAELLSGSPSMTFSLGTYFDKLDVPEAIAHEFAMAQELSKPDRPTGWADLPLRSLIGDPFDLRRRAVMPAIETMTLRRQRSTGGASFLLHWRDPAKVATDAGIYGLIPAGEFQPSSIASWDVENDFDLWRNVVREYSEELLGEPERDGSQSEPLQYDEWPFFRALQNAKEDGRVAVYCLGVGLDALRLAATILTVVVIDDDVFDDLFGGSVRVNAEGVLITAAESTTVSEGIPFNTDSIRRLLTQEPMASPSACILYRAWRLRDQFLKR